MSDLYEYRIARIRRGARRELQQELTDQIAPRTAAAGGSMYALFAGMIGFATDDAVLMRTWPDDETLAASADKTLSSSVIIESSAERLIPSMRPIDATPPRLPGVYAHRWFWLQPQDWLEFQRLSEDGVWPYFESDGCRIIGLWRSAEPGPLAKALLITRYPSVAHWERTRLQSPDVPDGADEHLYHAARDAGRRRAELTERSIARLARLLSPI
ncbi:MAG: hypothetical protein WD359_00110 [Dehalococcoidia bacterium]